MQRCILVFFTAIFCLCITAAQAEDTVSIEGKLLMLDDMTPHVAVPVEAIRNGEVVDLVLSDEKGKYQFVNLESGRYQVRCQVLGGYVYYRATDGALSVTPYEIAESATWKDAGEVLYIRRSGTLRNIDFRFAPFKKGAWRSYKGLNGLANEWVHAIHRSPDGVMWFGTAGAGISQYDGRKFINLTAEDGLVGNRIHFIYDDTDGTIWFGTNRGVSHYDRKTFTNFTTEDGLADNMVTPIHRDPDGIMWFGTWGSGVSRYDGKEFITLSTKDGLANNSVMTIYSDPGGIMWFGTGSGVSRYNGKTFVNFTTEDGLAYNSVRIIHGDLDGVMWFGTTGGGVSRYDGKKFTNLTTRDGLAHNYVRAIHSDPDGVMWFGTAGGGVSRYDGSTFVNFTTEDGLVGNDIEAIYRDMDGVFWFATRGDGISCYDERTFVNFTTEDGFVEDHLRAVYSDPNGMIWFGTHNSGVSRYDGKTFTNLTEEDGLATNTVIAIHGDTNGIMWFAGYGGVSRYDGKTFTNLTKKDGLATNTVTAIHGATNGVIWFGGNGAVSRYDGQEFVNFTIEDGLMDGSIRDIYGDPDGIMWFSGDGGVSRYDGREFTKFNRKDIFADHNVGDIHRDPDGVVWFGTGGGVFRYNGLEFTRLTTEDGLEHNTVYDIYRDSGGVIWFGTGGGGVSRYDGVAWAALDTRDGLAGNTVWSIYQDEDGTMWFATNKGITRYRQSIIPPNVNIISITADQTYRNLSAIPTFVRGTRVAIEYNAIDLKTLPEKRQYRYRIQAFSKSLSKKEMDSDWRKPTKATSFDYTFRESGTYTFQVQAIDRDLNYSEPASVEIRIMPPPFYTRVWFIIGTILAAFLIPTIIYAILLTRQKKQEFEPIQNPYIVGNPIRTKEMFFGRKSDFEFIRIKLSTEEAGLVIVFAGARRSGKTSILHQILNGELGERLLPVLLDMQAMAVDDEAEFFEKIASEISEALVGAGLEPGSVNFHEGNPIREFERFIAGTMEKLAGRGLLLLLDEYELIESKIDDGVLRPDIITFFAGLLEAHPRLSFIFTGSQHLEGRNISYWRVLIGKSLYRRISFLSERDALRLIAEPVADRVIYPRGIPERIFRLTAGQPFYTQVVCQNMMDRLNEVGRNRVRQEDVEAVAQELADNPLPQMIYFWDGLERNQKGALSLLGEMLEDSNRYASAQTLINFAQEQNLELDFELSDLEGVLGNLFTNEVLERERAGEGQYEYRFRADLFRLWVRQAHSVWQQA
ncbi:two-component regulator propeller domain-containing protein [Candidatus Poribacteria bacterium]